MPLAVVGSQVPPDVWIAISSAILVALLVLTLEVEDINRKRAVIKIAAKMFVLVIVEHCNNLAIIVVSYDPKRGPSGKEFHQECLIS